MPGNITHHFFCKRFLLLVVISTLYACNNTTDAVVNQDAAFFCEAYETADWSTLETHTKLSAVNKAVATHLRKKVKSQAFIGLINELEEQSNKPEGYHSLYPIFQKKIAVLLNAEQWHCEAFKQFYHVSFSQPDTASINQITLLANGDYQIAEKVLNKKDLIGKLKHLATQDKGKIHILINDGASSEQLQYLVESAQQFELYQFKFKGKPEQVENVVRGAGLIE